MGRDANRACCPRPPARPQLGFAMSKCPLKLLRDALLAPAPPLQAGADHSPAALAPVCSGQESGAGVEGGWRAGHRLWVPWLQGARSGSGFQVDETLTDPSRGLGKVE